jgi:hypothetical protein
MDMMGLNRKRGDGTWMKWREWMKSMQWRKRRKAAVGTWLVDGVLWIALSLLTLLMACPSWATTWTVTSEAEMVAAMAGDADGDVINITQSFSVTDTTFIVNKDVTIQGIGTPKPVITRTGSGEAFSLHSGATGSTLQNFALTGGSHGIRSDISSPNVRRAHNITIDSLDLYGLTYSGIIAYGADGWLITDSTFREIGSGTDVNTTDAPIRFNYSFYNLHLCNAAWDESVNANVTVTADTETKVEGTGSVKLAVGADVAAGEILATDNITSTGSNYLYDKYLLGFWLYTSIALDAGDLQILLDDTANCASPLEIINVTATRAGRWMFIQVPLANPSLDLAVVSVGLKQVVDKGAYDIYIDEIAAYRGGTNTTITNNVIEGYYDSSAAAWKTGTLLWFTWPSDNVLIQGNTLKNAGTHGINFYLPETGTYSSCYSNNVTITGNYIENVSMIDSNDFIGWGVGTGTISHNTLLQTTTSSGKISWGVETWGKVYPRNTTIEDNTIGGGALVSGMHGEYWGSTISNNYFEADESCIYEMTGNATITGNICKIVDGATPNVAGIYIRAYYGPTGHATSNLYNNTLYTASFTKPGILVEETYQVFDAINLKNNIVVGFPQAVAVKHALAGLPLTHTNNLFYGNTKNIQYYDGANWQDLTLDATEITSDPLLASNFHLLPGSPAINGGVNVCTGEGVPYSTCTGSGTGTWTDIKGSVVPHNGKISIGAYQFTSFDTEKGESAARKSWRRVFRKF